MARTWSVILTNCVCFNLQVFNASDWDLLVQTAQTQRSGVILLHRSDGLRGQFGETHRMQAEGLF